MDFVHSSFKPGETIAAIATPLGEGGIGIVRISGDQAIRIANCIFSGPVDSYSSHTAHLGLVRDTNGDRIDQALLLIMRAPKSYTGEDTIEIQCHGGVIVTRKILEAALSAGARAALPGEFTFKAFMNGKIDLSQAEAVQELISAKSEEAFSIAGKQLEGKLSEKIAAFQQELNRIGAIFEAWVDFPEEGPFFLAKEELLVNLQDLAKEIQCLIKTFHDGKKLQRGVSVGIIGAPNAGKSSLMNALLEEDRAIVTSIPGTTRDLLCEEITMSGFLFHLIDTAGIRKTEETVEKEGIRRSREVLHESELVLLVIDGSTHLEEEDYELLSSVSNEKTIIVWNKSDLPRKGSHLMNFPYQVEISAKHHVGLDQLKEQINRLIWNKGTIAKNEILITKTRHQEALKEASQALELVIQGLNQGLSPEFLSIDIRTALKGLGRIIGTNISEDLLSSIFSQFCIGK
ncbi:MAG: tRNA uridine-5-carboxymethylaminomethyl(34) synthesis GTPase MnmE [Chlamydiales bacterium]